MLWGHKCNDLPIAKLPQELHRIIMIVQVRRGNCMSGSLVYGNLRIILSMDLTNEKLFKVVGLPILSKARRE